MELLRMYETLADNVKKTFEELTKNTTIKFFEGEQLSTDDEGEWEHGLYEVRSYTASGVYYLYDVRVLRIENGNLYVSKCDEVDGKELHIPFSSLSTVLQQIDLISSIQQILKS